MQNIILIGMPGSGKSTVGVILAKILCADFVDTDLVIQKMYKKPLQQMIAENGTEAFLDTECSVIENIECTESVIATGGSAVCRDAAMQKLKKGGKAVFLDVPVQEIERRIDNITTRGIAMEHGQTLKQVYEIRRPLYEKYADVTIKCEPGRTAEQICAEIIRALI